MDYLNQSSQNFSSQRDNIYTDKNVTNTIVTDVLTTMGTKASQH